MNASQECSDPILDRAEGCLLGQLAGDSLGSLVEFWSAGEIRRRYPDGVRHHADGGTWDTVAGQPTDDSEMALALARVLVHLGEYDVAAVQQTYVDWLESGPFDCGGTIAKGLQGMHSPGSEANGALMRISPLGVFGTNHAPADVAAWARLDSAITHVHSNCQNINALFAMAIADAIRTGASPATLYQRIVDWSGELDDDGTVQEIVLAARTERPESYTQQQGWVVIAFQNALWQMLHAPNLEEGVVDTVGQGGDTDTNAAICGALLGAVYGRRNVPARWISSVLNCRPQEGAPGVRQPRPTCYWPTDALELAKQLLEAGSPVGESVD